MATADRVKSAGRTIDVLEVLAGAGTPLTLVELHRLLEVPRSSLHILLRTLIACGWVESAAHGTAYRLGLRALRVGASYLDRDPVVSAAGPVLTRLRETLGETVHLGRLDGAEVVYLASLESRNHFRVTSRVGRRLPGHATALGKVLLAARDPGEVSELLPASLVPLTRHTVTDHAELRTELAGIRSRGWAWEVEQNTLGLACFAVAVPAHGAVDAVSCSVPLDRVTDERRAAVITGLSAAADEIARLSRSHAG
ncbi:DNA-binding IclR family transcriptional regulator [Saccharothrix ecbatanensis]|uniref:Glycerol operon regulatory protein n=1 Tax=Saccharothrix ecbatanensis TaxID=1105145 RepID=A0A7W9HJY2_9PSEU|nr:IclR family transcriptional regulator [Saccharothrix ecbatanensis]MBB5803376.1 DNA-binding IclR family transcriptional regulator [Saccharothrix ecbatanensis]